MLVLFFIAALCTAVEECDATKIICVNAAGIKNIFNYNIFFQYSSQSIIRLVKPYSLSNQAISFN